MLRLMIVDDEQIIREALSEMIDYPSLGYQLIATARNGMEAYDIICDEYPDVVITDIRMPILNGLELIERSLKTDSDISFILLSGYSEFEYAKQAMKYGVRHYLLKPTNKQELIDTLLAIRKEHEEAARNQKSSQKALLAELQIPLEQNFIMEALEHLDNLEPVFHKYQPLLSIPDDCLHACICSFVKEKHLKPFAADVNKILSAHNTSLQFPILYVKNSVVLIFPTNSLSMQEAIKNALMALQYPGQTVSFETTFLHSPSTHHLYQEILQKIARFERILFLGEQGATYEIRNHVAAPWKVRRLVNSIAAADDETQAFQLLDSAFADTMALECAYRLGLGLFLQSDRGQKNKSLNSACDFFRLLYSCQSMDEIRKLMRMVFLRKDTEEDSAKVNANVTLLKAYIDQHLGSENLSLKWLAENYLFVSVGYLSKTFMKEEGMRFSDYLNKKRMEEAIRLMAYYRDDNIKYIAKQVGFGSNPQYFSQVFKRYTGSTPTEYIMRTKIMSS